MKSRYQDPKLDPYPHESNADSGKGIHIWHPVVYRCAGLLFRVNLMAPFIFKNNLDFQCRGTGGLSIRQKH